MILSDAIINLLIICGILMLIGTIYAIRQLSISKQMKKKAELYELKIRKEWYKDT